MDLRLKGHTALITGGASGIGWATAKQFAEEGCALLLWDRSETVVEVADELRKLGVDVRAEVVDVVDFDQMQATWQSAVQSGFLGSKTTVDHVVHSAAIGSGKYGFPFTGLSPGDWRQTLEVNVLGMVNVAHALTPSMVAAKQGTFVFLSSVAGQMGSQTDPPYSASKAANINFAQCMAKDLAKHNVRVNTVCPGMVQIPLNRSVWQAWYERAADEERLPYDAWAEQKIRSVVPLGRWQSCEDIASMVVFLSSDRTKEVTGQTINVDGGFVMHC